MTSLKKHELVLAQKTIAARQVRLQSSVIKEELQMMKSKQAGHRASTASLQGSAERQMNKSSSLPTLGTSEFSPKSSHTGASMLLSPKDSRPLPSPSQTHSNFEMEKKGHSASHMSKDNQALVEELSHRSVTDKTQLRKLQFSVSKSLEAGASHRPHTTQGNNRPPSSARHSTQLPPGSPMVDPETQRPVGDENFFMPKRKILLPNGASLQDIYESKRRDMWGQIIKAQYKEDEANKVSNRQKKLEADHKYGVLLTNQVLENEARRRRALQERDQFALIEGAHAKGYEDLEKNRQADAVRRHKEFIQNALEDIQVKHNRKMQDLTEELTASAIMIRKARDAVHDEEERQRKHRDFMKAYQDKIYQENLDDLRRKQENKLKSQEEDKRIIEENENQYRKEMERRERELQAKMVRSTEGPAHHIVESLVTLKKAKDEEFYRTLTVVQENSLNKQLRDSELASTLRSQQNGDTLTEEWVRNTRIKEQRRKEDEERNRKIISTMHAMIKKQEEEDRLNRIKRHDMAMTYQRELDQQVREVRQRSFDSLTKTMSDAERQYNADLIKKAAAFM